MVTARRRVVAWVAGMLTVLTVVAPSAAMAGSPGGQFADPPSSDRPKFFWTWPGNLVENAELAREVREMSDGGFGGGLILPVLYGVPPTGNPPETYEWGTPSFADHVGAALHAARDEDFTLDLFLGPSWPLASPAVTGNERTLGSQELGLAKTKVVGPAQLTVAPPRRAGERPDDRLVAVTGARVAAEDSAGITLDPDTAIDLTQRVGSDGIVRWDVPAGRWILFAFWQAPTRQVASSYPAAGPHVVDHFSRTAVNAVLDYFDENVLAPQDRRTVAAAEQIFTDSYEMQAELLWTHDFLAEFRRRRGYDLTPYLPVVFVPGQHRLGPYYQYCRDRTRRCSPPRPAHDFPRDAGQRVRRDYYQTLSELWVDEHLTPLRQWSNRRGLTYSNEPYGLTADVIEGAKAADVPKAEDHWNRTVDFLRTVTSGAHLAGRRKASMELGTAFGKDYMMTLRELKRRADKSFASGVNELVVLGHPYREAPGTDWPTWQPFSTEFSPGFSEAWNSANPLWRHMKPLADYLARGQTLLQAGEPVADIAVYRDAYGYIADPFATDDPPEPALTRELLRSGFAYDFVNPTTLLERGTRARDGRLRAGEPEYRGLVVDTDFDRGMGVENHAMDPAVAERLVEVARAGVPIVFVGGFPQRGVSFRDPGGEDAALRRALDRLRRSSRVRVVADASAVPAALTQLGARADLASDAPQDVYGVHRRAGGRDYWFLWNPSEQPVRFTGSFAALGRVPERWDMWTGRVSRLARYRESRGRVQVPIELDPLGTTVIAFGPGSRLHVVETDAEETAVDDGRLVLRSTTGGFRDAVLSNGARRAVRFPALPAAHALEQWDLRVEGAVPTGEDRHELRLTELADWRAIPELAHTSGTGVYRTVVEVNDDWPAGAYLEVGRVEGGAQVRVNGRLAHPASVPPARIPVGALLRRGRNVIEVELTTTLKNRLVELGVNTPGFARFRVRSETQPYGLLGPVRLVPYAERTVGRR